MELWTKRIVLGLVIAGVITLILFLLKPSPVPVDIASIDRGSIVTTIDEEGETHVKEVYRISAPIGGKIERLTIEAGDSVEAGDLLARIRSVDSPIRDVRTQRELAAVTRAAEAAVEMAKPIITEAKAALDFAETELRRAQQLAKDQNISASALQQFKLKAVQQRAHLAEAKANLTVKQRLYESARINETQSTDIFGTDSDSHCCISVIAPIDGVVLSLLSESENVVQASTPLLDIGNLQDMEIIVDLLSADAVSISTATKASIEDWGGSNTLNATVTRIEPAGFTKISALGIEEQRVHVMLDIQEPPEKWEKLGHAYRVNVKLFTDNKTDVLRIPLSALFRDKDSWATYRKNLGTAEVALVELGLFSTTHAEIISGLQEDDEVIVYPSDRLSQGVEVKVR